MKIEKVYTDNPLLDEIIYNSKQLATGTVLKDQDRADAGESVESLNAGDVYVTIKQGFGKFSDFYYDRVFLENNVPNLSTDDVMRYAADNELIPESLRPTIVSIASKQFLESYVEKNNYYRMLNGEPPFDTLAVFEGLYIDCNTINKPLSMVKISKYFRDTPGSDYKLIHKLDIGTIEVLYERDIIDSILSNTDRLKSIDLTFDDVEYLRHIGNRAIDYYTSRSADKFGLIYCPDCESVEVKARYKDKLEANRRYMLHTIYSDAYKINSENYDHFMMVFLVIQTIIDLIIELPDYIIKRDIFDARTCRYIFESNGVKYFRDIPLVYQIALVKNLNKLIKFKSSDKCIVDIVSIFGIDSIKIFKYYILKDRNINNDSEMEYYNYKDNNKDYTLKFIKVPIMENYDDYIRTTNNILTYDSIIDSDRYWTGDKEYDNIKSNIRNMDFTVLRSKYYSVEALIDLTKRNFTLVYFTNMLLYNKIDKSKLLVNLPNISTSKKFELVDVIIFLYSLSYLYYGAEDSIMDSRKKIAEILGFNTEADLQAIANYIAENYNGMTLEDLGVEGYKIPPNGEILSFKQLENLYFENTKVYNHVKNMLINPPKNDKRIYDAYKYIYKSLFIMDCNMEYYKLSNGNMANTYKQFLQEKDPLLFETLNSMTNISNIQSRQELIVNTIQSVTQYLKDYVDRDIVKLDDVFAGLPSISLDFIKKYVEQVIDFFKSFKIFTHDSSILYTFSDRFENYVQLVELILLWYTFDKSQYVHIEDWIADMKVAIGKKDSYEMLDKVWLSFDTWLEATFEEFYSKEDYSFAPYYYDNDTNSGSYDHKLGNHIYRDEAEYYAHFYADDNHFEKMFRDDHLKIMLIDMIKEDRVNMSDLLKLAYTLEFDDYLKDSLVEIITDVLVTIEPSERIGIKDDILKVDTMIREQRYRPHEAIGKSTTLLNSKDNCDMNDMCYFRYTSK